MFIGLDSLQELTLSSNQIASIEARSFNGLSNLETLWLDSNNLAELRYDMFLRLDKLRRIALNMNNISSVNGGVFTGLLNLKILDLDDNSIAELRSDSFRGIDTLTQIWLFNNKLSTFESSVFTGLPRPLQLTLGRNPDLQCDTRLCWLKEGEKEGWITWISFQNRPLEPECSDGTQWKNLNLDCPDEGWLVTSKLLVFLIQNLYTWSMSP